MHKTDFSVFQAWTMAEAELRSAEREMIDLARLSDPEGRMLPLLAPLLDKRAAASRALQMLLQSTAGDCGEPGRVGPMLFVAPLATDGDTR